MYKKCHLPLTFVSCTLCVLFAGEAPELGVHSAFSRLAPSCLI